MSVDRGPIPRWRDDLVMLAWLLLVVFPVAMAGVWGLVRLMVWWDSL